MKITMSKRDDILRKQREYNEMYDQHQSERDKWRSALYNRFNEIAYDIKKAIGNTSLDLEVDVKDGLWGGLIVRINNGSNPHDSQALNWNWAAQLKNDGELKTESGSWSGLSATSQEQLDNLKESVRILEILNNMDWKTILNTKLPDEDEYVKTPAPVYDHFDDQLLELDVEEAAEKGLLIRGHAYKRYPYNATVYYKIVNMTDKSFKVQEIGEDDIRDKSEWGDPYTIRKDKFFDSILYTPFTTAEV